MLDVGVSMNDSQIEQRQLVTEANDHVALRAIDDMLRVDGADDRKERNHARRRSTVRGQRLCARFVAEGARRGRQAGGDRATTKDGTSIHFSITPHKNPPYIPPTLHAI
jgi:hypothetical protein